MTTISQPEPTVSGTSLDPITFEVLANAFTAVVDDMGVMLEKVSFSTVTTIGKDYACVLADCDGDVFARGAGGLPLLTGTATARLRTVIDVIGRDNLHLGDVYLHNDPYTGGTHGQDVAAIMPVFVDDELVAFVTSASHWPDVGGAVPGSFNSDADSTHGESILIPPIAIIRRGEWVADTERFLLHNIRIPEIVRGDLRGMVEACRTGASEFLALVDKYGLPTIRQEMTALLDHAESLMRRKISELPDGTVTFTDLIDRDPGSDSDAPVEVVVDLTINGDEMVVDFTRSGDQAIGPINATRSATTAAFTAGIKEIFHEIPWNAGFERPITFVTRRGSIVDAEYPHPVSGVAASPAEKVISCVHGCFIQVLPERSMACPTNLVNVSVSGRDRRSGRDEEYVMYLWLAGGWGARPGARDSHTSMFPLGPGTNLQPAESLERIYPIRFEAFELAPDSEGAGRHRGGFGFRCPFVVTGGEATINVQGDRQVHRGWGYDGGQPASGNGLTYAPGTDLERRIPIMSARNRVDPETVLDYWQSGGGGWGDPLERPAEWVLDDVIDELLTVDRAADVYGVIISIPEGDLLSAVVDDVATVRARDLRLKS